MGELQPSTPHGQILTLTSFFFTLYLVAKFVATHAEVSERKMVQVQERVAQERATQLEERVRELEVTATAAAEQREQRATQRKTGQLQRKVNEY